MWIQTGLSHYMPVYVTGALFLSDQVADFGLAKYQAAEATAVSTRVMGTFG
jgi:hypothetical protein